MTGEHNCITDVTGVLIGHYTNKTSASGITVLLCPEGAIAGVDVRGSAPGTRETDLLQPQNLVQEVQAVALCGGSVYGLAAAQGVVDWLAENKLGFPLEQGHVAPIVPAAALFDLGRGAEYVPPVRQEWGYNACRAAKGGMVEMGCVGAGTGALAGGVKGGLGSASQKLESGLTVGALVAVNSLGSVIDPASGLFWEARLETANELGAAARRAVRLPREKEGRAAGNTTIGVVATDAMLDKAQAQKVAQMAHDGMARAIRPSHTMYDGDTIFCLATGEKDISGPQGFFAGDKAGAINEIGHAAANCFSRAVMRAVASAKSMGAMKALADLPDL